MAGEGTAALVGIGFVAFVGLIIAAASEGPVNDYTSLCQNADFIRIEDDACERGDHGSTIMYISTGSDYHAPAIGGKVDQSRMVKTMPIGKTLEKARVPREGGVVKSSPGITRGGFGGKMGSGG